MSNAQTQHDAGFEPINLNDDSFAVPPGRYAATISDARVITNSTGDTRWLFVDIELHNEDGVFFASVEDKFVTIGAKPTSPHHSRLREGLKKLAIYGEAVGVDFNGVTHLEVPGMLVGRRVVALVGRRGTGVQSENRVVSVVWVAA